ncbi:MAG: fructoselysine 6-kinase [Anaerolineaceae bacterium]|nr:fructoselysine 6-kinase [Anaerolineaceae bacterium]
MRVAAVGDNCMDVYSSLGKAYPGGNTVNFAVYILQLGAQSSYTGVVGNDKYGIQLKKALAAKGVDISHLHTKNGNTAITQVELVAGERIFGDYDEGVMANFHLTEEDIFYLCQHDLIHTSIWGKIENNLPELHQKGVKISFDFADKLDHEIVQQALPYVEYAFFSYTQDDQFIRDYLKNAQSKGPKIAIATLGENGSLAFDGNNFTNFGIVPVNVVDSIGAGDSFIAGFLFGVLSNKSLLECLAQGAKKASETLQYMGAWKEETGPVLCTKVAAIGDNCMDIYPKLGKQYPTGNIVDFAVTMQQLGIPSSVISVTGNDENGKIMLDTLSAEGLDLTHLHMGTGPTAVTYMDMDGKDRVHGEYVEGVLEKMVFTSTDIEFAARHCLVHTAFWGKADSQLEKLRSHGALISFDYATKKDDPMIRRTLPFVDYAFFSFAGAQKDAQNYLAEVCANGPQVAVATFGSEGSMAYDGLEFFTFGIYPAKVENTVGAGDAFIAGFMFGVLSGYSLQDCLSTGARTAASVVEIFEPWQKTK